MEGNRPDENRPMHEQRDIDPWAIGKFVVGLVFFTGLSLLFLIGIFRYFESVNPIKTESLRNPAKIRLEESQTEVLVKVRAAEDQLLNKYDWVDKQKGVVRIPIDRAMDITAQRGLASLPPQQQQTQTSPVSVPTEASLGVQK
jgi:hypothetical protein